MPVPCDECISFWIAIQNLQYQRALVLIIRFKPVITDLRRMLIWIRQHHSLFFSHNFTIRSRALRASVSVKNPCMCKYVMLFAALSAISGFFRFGNCSLIGGDIAPKLTHRCFIIPLLHCKPGKLHTHHRGRSILDLGIDRHSRPLSRLRHRSAGKCRRQNPSTL